MAQNQKIKYYSPMEEKINIISHVIGLILSVIALLSFSQACYFKWKWYANY